MDAQLVARELEMTLLAKLLEGRHVDAGSNISMPAAALLHLLRTYLGPDVAMNDLQAAAAVSPHLAWTPYSREIEVAGIRSDQGVRLSVFRWHRSAASRAPFQQLLARHADRPRPPIAATTFLGGPLGLNGVSFEVRNEGYGTQADIEVQQVAAPDWVAVSRQGNRITLSACPAAGGVYRGEVTIGTNANTLSLGVSTESAAFSLPPRNEVTLDELLAPHPDIDREATEQLLDRILTGLKFERLPGGLFLRRTGEAVQERSNGWWLTETEIVTGCLVAVGYPSSFTVYADADGRPDKYSEVVTAGHGQLGGGLAELLECLDVQVGQRLTLDPYRGGYKMSLSPAEPWRTAKGHTFWLQGPAETVLRHAEVLDVLVQRTDDKNITVNLLLSGAGALPEALVRQHRSGRLTIRLTQEALPYKLIVCDEDAQAQAYAPPFGPVQRPAAAPTALWEASPALEGRDYREQAWRRGRRGEDSDEWGLLDLELSVAMERLAHALRPLPSSPVSVSAQVQQQLLSGLPRHARDHGIHEKPLLAAPLLEHFGVTAAQVNAAAYGVRVTQGGYLTLRPQDLGGQRDWARYVGNLYGGVIHHSQLRKLVEAFTGHPLEAQSFVASSLHDLGWGGNGYRRPKQGWEPATRELTPFTAEALAHFGTPQEALRWLRRHVAASEAQLERAVQKAAPLVENLKRLQPAPAPIKVPGRAPHEVKSPKPVTPHKLHPAPLSTAAQTQKAAPRRLTPVEFAPLPKDGAALADPRLLPSVAVQLTVHSLIQQEGPITESWLLRRYALRSRCNQRLIRDAVLSALKLCVESRGVQQLTLSDGHVEYLIPGQKVVLRERGTRAAEDISFGEWCELLRTLGLTSAECDEDTAHREAVRAFKFGTDAGRVRPLIRLALSTVRRQVT